MKARGFTIVEATVVIVVIAILSIVTSVAISSAIRAMEMGGAVDKVVSDLHYCQTMAGGTGKWYGASFEVSPLNQYTLYTTTGTKDTVIENPAKLGTLFVVKLYDDFGITISLVTIEGGNKVEFSPLGVPFTDKYGAALTGDGIITLNKDSYSRTIRISAAGRVYVQ